MDERRLVAIMFTDIVGYTVMMAEDEEQALQAIAQHREILKPLVEKHKGSWLKEMGDGTLSSFPSTIEAINCATDIQKKLNDLSTFKIRIGIHLGDVVFTDTDVFGDGVNVASRIEPTSIAGGIAISGQVYDTITSNKSIEAKYLGEKTLKHVRRPVRIYAISSSNLPTAEVFSSHSKFGQAGNSSDESQFETGVENTKSPSYGQSEGLVDKLKRHKIFRVAVVYAIVAWVLMQISSDVLPALQTPQWAVSFVTVLLLLGFPIALVLAWAFELTPDGVKADSGVQSTLTTANSTDRKLIYAILGLVVIGMGFQIVDRFLLDSGSNQSAISISSEQASGSITPNERVRRAIIPLGPMTSSQLPFNDLRTSLSLSPDGSRLAYTSFSNGQMQLHLRELDQLESRTLGPPLDNPAFSPLVFSPDGQWLAYVDGAGSLRKISVSGGGVQTITEDVSILGFDWAEDDTLVFTGTNFRLGRVSASSGPVQLLDITTDSSGVETHHYAQFLPGLNTVLFTRLAFVSEEGQIMTVELFDTRTNESRLLIQNAAHATYSPTDHIVFMRESSLWAVPFDSDNQQISGAEVRLIEGIHGIEGSGAATYTLSSSGDLVYLPGENTESSFLQKSTLSWVDRSGNETSLEMVPQAYRTPRLSPDGNRVALTVYLVGEFSDIWSFELDRGTLSRITFSPHVWSPIWSPDGNRLMYDTSEGIRSINSTGIGKPETLLTVPSELISGRSLTAFTADGTELLYSEGGRGPDIITASGIHKLSLAPEHTTSPVIVSDFIEEGGIISPDGHWLAYVTEETGRNEVYLRPWPDIDSNKWQISTGGGGDPQWAADTGELFFRNRTEDGIETWTVTLATEGEFNASIPELLFTSDHLYFDMPGNYSVAADGQRFMMLKPVAEEDLEPVAIDTNLVLVENFAAELRRRVPADTK